MGGSLCRFSQKASNFTFWGNDYPNGVNFGRDYGVFITDENIVNRVKKAIDFDFNCPSDMDIINLTGNQGSLVWTSGATNSSGRYPPRAQILSSGRLKFQGNAREVFINVINSAKKELMITTETFADKEIIKILAARIRKGIKVTLLMTSEFRKESNEYTFGEGFDTITKAGGKVVLLYPSKPSRRVEYIHGKIMIVDPDDMDNSLAMVSSQNIASFSLDYNKELGVIIGQPDAISFFVSIIKNGITIAQKDGYIWPPDENTRAHKSGYMFANREVIDGNNPNKPEPCGKISLTDNFRFCRQSRENKNQKNSK